MQTLFQDLRYGVRMLLKKPGFTLIAIVTLALGIGANTAIFSVVNAVLLRPLPYAEPERLVSLWETSRKNPAANSSVSYPNFYDWRAQSQSFERMASYYTGSATLTGAATPVNLRLAVVSAELFPLLGAKTQLGRVFLPEENKAGNSAGRVVILSHRLWQRQFSADPAVVGRSITLSGKPFNVVGVMPAGFQYPIEAQPTELWITSAIDGEKADPKDQSNDEQRGAHYLQVIGRLKPGVKLEQAQAELSVIAANLEKQYPDTNTRAGARVIPYHADLVADYRGALWIILGAVGCVLLIACANVANLLLARATARYKEIAVRSALGASRRRIIRQLLTESLTLSLTGGLLGLLLAWWGTEMLVKLIPEDLPRLSEINLDRWVFVFTLLVSAATGIIFGLAPALQASKVELTEAMKEGGRASGAGGRSRMRNALVVAEIAIAIVVLVGAGLLLQSFRKLQQVDLGYDTRNVLTATVEIADTQYPKKEQVAEFFKTLLEKVKALPGVESASGITPLPLSGDTFSITFEVEGRNIPKGEQPSAHFRVIREDYFPTMKTPLLAGRDFTANDTTKSTPVIIVNEAFAQKHFPGENPLGKHLKPGISLGEEKKWYEIVGIVRNVKHRQSLGHDYEPEYFMPHSQMAFSSLNLVVRTKNDPRTLAGAIQREVSSLDKDVPIYHVKTLEQYLGAAVSQPKFNALLLSLFAGLALALTAIGLYGVMAYSVAQRTQEIGVRIALGAGTGDVLKMVLRHGLTLTAIGLAVGLSAAFALTRLLSAMLYGVTATDPLTFAVIALLLTGVALPACYFPARRATKVDPMIALRYE
ncbi:MAG TPA: ABC transporter permease [Blastocatellia bacterium]|nr:ABC transporter permease [Blastocatellia bacterium]HNG28471.1 ABC transporter permease [Blastocatellia bacterium]